MIGDEIFGPPDKIKLARRGAAVRQLLRNNPRYGYYGRLVALNDPRDDVADILSALATLQGAGVCHFFPRDGVDSLYAELTGRGYLTDRHEHFLGGEEALEASRQILATHDLPESLTVSRVDDATPRDLLEQTAEISFACGVLPVPGAIMRGGVVPGLCLVARDAAGRVVSTASSYRHHHPDSPRADIAHWGMLATREEWRGQRIGLILGAMAIIEMWERFGARGFMTGIRSDNAASQALCNKLGVRATEWVYAQCIDPAVLGGTSITK